MTEYCILSPLPLFFHQSTPKESTSFVKYCEKLKKTYAKLKPGEKINLEQIQRVIQRWITTVHKLEQTIWDLKVFQKAIST